MAKWETAKWETAKWETVKWKDTGGTAHAGVYDRHLAAKVILACNMTPQNSRWCPGGVLPPWSAF